ncbi:MULTISPECIES: HU family DNA-binding protein [unclassified Sphingopyxis]|uniref:HU family DNA-binding protein n=1 Tax=unclassified Sphingopyxis TaxID=2614943 RepID=UPI003FA755F0
MGKTLLTKMVSEQTELTLGDAKRVVEMTFDAIAGALKKGDEVRIHGFGTFSVASRNPLVRRNPRTGEPMMIQGAALPKFKAGRALKDALNG